MSNNFAFWDQLTSNIKAGLCTPFLGSGISAPKIPLGGEAARKFATYWAKKKVGQPEYQYPFSDSDNLARLSQYYTVITKDSNFVKKTFVDEIIKPGGQLNFIQPEEVEENYRVLASLELPLYITTNYDSFMYNALCTQPLKSGSLRQEVKRLSSEWKPTIRTWQKLALDIEKINPSSDKPVVFHLHGRDDIHQTLVLTEDDYIEFLINTAEAKTITHATNTPSGPTPTWVEEALTKTTLLFVGYSFSDWNFNVIFRSIHEYMERSDEQLHISVQLDPGEGKKEWSNQQKDIARKYLERYLERDNINVFWGPASEFLSELKKNL